MDVAPTVSRNILVTTLGTSWQIVPELIAFTNPEQYPLMANATGAAEHGIMRRQYDVEPVDEIWLVTTSGQNLDALLAWHRASGLEVALRVFMAEAVQDLMTAVECRNMADLIYRVVLHAHHISCGGQVCLSVAGGRKTMSADMQQAAYLFGCHVLLHVATASPVPDWMKNRSLHPWLHPLEKRKADQISPIVVASGLSRSPIIELAPAVTADNYPLTTGEQCNVASARSDLANELAKRIQNSQSLLANFRNKLIGKSKRQNFLGLYTLDPGGIQTIENAYLGRDPLRRSEELSWLRRLPKAELHCHLGGILDATDLIDVALAVEARVAEARKRDDNFDAWLKVVYQHVIEHRIAGIRETLPRVAVEASGGFEKAIRTCFNIPQPLAVCGFILCFRDHPDKLEAFIFQRYLDDRAFCAIAIDAYESHGDLQGSGILQCEATLRRTLLHLKRKAREENIRYLELRCSPVNYTRDKLRASDVVRIIMEELDTFPDCMFRLIFIASRHGDMDRVKQHVRLYQAMKGDSTFRRMFVGFDLAGNEAAKRPAEMRSIFLPLLADCINITIHAGEGHDAENIWEAAYHLNADRIGHGLTLVDRPELLSKFIDRRIAVEMCPSSNYQIVGFDDFQAGPENGKIYPLKQYLDAGLRVTVNTDDPGMSRTTLTAEFYKAACMTKGGLSKWDILQLIKNSFDSTFCTFSEREALLASAGREIIKIVTKTE